MTRPSDGEIERYTDHYFNRTKQVIGRFGDSRVTYAVFMRRPVVFAPRLALQWLEELGRSRNTSVDLDLREVRPVGEVERQPGGDAELHIQAEISVGASVSRREPHTSRVVEKDIGFDPQISSGLDVSQTP